MQFIIHQVLSFPPCIFPRMENAGLLFVNLQTAREEHLLVAARVLTKLHKTVAHRCRRHVQSPEVARHRCAASVKTPTRNGKGGKPNDFHFTAVIHLHRRVYG